MACSDGMRWTGKSHRKIGDENLLVWRQRKGLSNPRIRVWGRACEEGVCTRLGKKEEEEGEEEEIWLWRWPKL